MARKNNEDKLSFEEALEQLEAIIQQVETGQIGLEQSIDQYEKGMQLIKYCREILTQAEKRIEIIKTEGGPTPPPGPETAAQ